VASIAVDRKSMGHTVAERSWKDADFVCFSLFSVAVMGKCCNVCGDGYTISSRVVWRQRLQVSREHRLFSIGSRWDIRWVSGCGKSPTLCVFPVFNVAVMENCCDACGDGED
jgi:hypothetical protein